MQTTTTIPATCDDEGFCAFETPPTEPADLPNVSAMGVVTLDEDGTFVSSRVLTATELAEAWATHHENAALA